MNNEALNAFNFDEYEQLARLWKKMGGATVYRGSGSGLAIAIRSDGGDGDSQVTTVDIQGPGGDVQHLSIRGTFEISELADALLQFVTGKSLYDLFDSTCYVTCFEETVVKDARVPAPRHHATPRAITDSR